MIGGTATVVGPLIGGVVVVFSGRYISESFPNTLLFWHINDSVKNLLSPAIFGIVLILLMYVLPDGIVGGWTPHRAIGAAVAPRRRRHFVQLQYDDPIARRERTDVMTDRRRVPVSRSARPLRRGRARGASCALVAAACGSGREFQRRRPPRRARVDAAGTDARSSTRRSAPADADDQGVTGDTITIGTSLPQSGTYSAFNAILKGEQSYFNYMNAHGGVTVAGKKYKIKLVAKDDAYDARARRRPTSTVADQQRQGVRVVQHRRHEEQPRDPRDRSTPTVFPTC